MSQFSHDTVQLLDEMAKWFRRFKVNSQNRPAVANEQGTAPEVYIARAPSGGIPASDGTTPGSAICDVRYIGPDGQLHTVGTSQTVYNVTDTAVDGSDDVSVHRDKFGKWIASVIGGGGGTTMYVSKSASFPTLFSGWANLSGSPAIYDFATLIPDTELIIPANTGYTKFTASFGARLNVANANSLLGTGICFYMNFGIYDLNSNTQISQSSNFGQGSIIYFTGTTPNSIYVGNYDCDGSSPTWQGSAAIEFITNVMSQARYCLMATLHIGSNNGVTMPVNIEFDCPLNVAAANVFSAMPFTRTVITPDITQLSVSATASSTGGAHTLAVNFTSTPSGGSGSYTYAWAFGDGGTSSSQNPSHSYTVAGTYRPTVVVTDTNGQSQAFTVPTITVT